ncbi:MAG: phosphoribosylaminoimidazolesuccinocarboxamide synthase, partial [Alphaproteobacteria bacterium]|nr:phosphoribosylaminoimidazolesuccinocarboxamide synthase [Alphaproteobacteria bacterium]
LMIPNHHIEKLGGRTQLVRELEMLPLEVIVRNRAAGSLCKRLGLERGELLPRTLVEFCLKDDDLGDPLISEEHITCFGWALPQELDDILAYALRVNDFLQGLFSGFGFIFVDMKLEFGRLYDDDGESRIVLADEITPDTCRIWGKTDKESFDKDLFREERDGLIDAYREIARQLGLPTAVVT